MSETNNSTAVATTEEEAKGGLLSKINIRSILPVIGFALILAFFAVATGGRIIQPKNLNLILNSTYVLMISSIGVFMIMSMGSLDFSQGSMIGLCCIVVCTLSHINPVLAVLGGIATGAVIGAINAFFHVRRQIASFIVTICMMFLLRGVVAFLTTDAPAKGAGYLQAELNNPTLLLGITIACLVVFYLVFTFTPLGSNLKAIGAGQTAARFAGIKVQKTKTLVYIAAGAITGFAAFVLAIRNGSVTATGGNMMETQIMLALVLGGLPISGGAKVRFSNIVVGVLTYCILDRGLSMMGFEAAPKQLIMGVVFLIFLAIFSDREGNQVIK
jgi:ribose transport system permease protein